MKRTLKTRHVLYAIVVVVLLAASGRFVFDRPAETLVERAHRICTDCGISGDEVDALIDNARHSTISRENSVRLWEQTYQGQENAAELMQLCRDCVEAICDAGFDAGRKAR